MLDRQREREGRKERGTKSKSKSKRQFLFQGEGGCREMQEGFTEEAPSTAA